MRIAKNAAKITGKVISVLLVLILAVNIYNIFMRQVKGVEQPTVFGYSTAVVISGSMQPAIDVGDMVLIHEQKDYEVRDIIMYRGERNFITHRIVARTENGYRTRGDSNNTEDPEIMREQAVGKVVMIIPGAGKAIGFLSTPLGMCMLVLAALVILLIPNIKKQ